MRTNFINYMGRKKTNDTLVEKTGKEEGKTEKSRRYVYDYIRVMACLFVILFHTADFGTGTVPQSILRTVDTIGLPTFFLLSGVLCLNSKKTLDIGNFYINRLIKIIIPFLIYGIIYSCWINTGLPLIMIPNHIHIIQAAKLIPYAIRQNIAGSQYFHLWFIYAITGLYLIMPYLKRMLDNMTEKQLYSLCALMLIFEGTIDYLPCVNIQIGIQNPFPDWIIYLIFGYTISQPFMNTKKYKFIAGIGFISLIFSFYARQFHPANTIGHYYDLAPHMVLIVCGTYALFMLLESKITHFLKLNKVVSFISSYCFSVYLLHGYFASTIYAIPHLSANVWLGSFERMGLIFVFSFAYAFVFDNIVTKNVIRLANWIYRKIALLIKKKTRFAN